MSELRLEGRLGVEIINPLKGCCVDSMLAWRPQVIGEKNKCLFCDNPMKTVRAGEAVAPNWTGMLNETKLLKEPDSFCIGSLFFSEKRFRDKMSVDQWCKERGMDGVAIEKLDDMAYVVRLAEVVPDTERILWAAPGVVAAAGVSKIDTGALASGGMLNPLQQGLPEESPGTTEDSKDEKPKRTQERACACPMVGKQMELFEKSLDSIVS